MNGFFSTKPNQIMGSLALLMLIIALGAYAMYTFKQSQYLWSGPTTISVSGEGEVFAVPDIGQFSFSVEAEGDTAGAAQEASATAMNSILAYLAESGVAETDVATRNYNLNPRYRYENQVCPMGSFCPPGEPVLDGFTVSQTVEVKVRDLKQAGDLIAGTGERGATNISGLSFTIDNTDALEAEARSLAITNAQTKAVQMANSLGVRIERMVGYYEEEGGPMPYYGMGGDMMARQEAAMVAPEMPTGEDRIVKRINITYQVK